MPIRAPPAPPLGDQPAVPPGTTPLRYRTFTGGLNTEASRPAIGDTQSYWLDGFIPIGDGNQRTCWGVSAPLYTAAVTANIVAFQTAVIGSAAFIIVFQADGSLVAVNYGTGQARTIAPPGTIRNPARGTFGLAAWGNSYIIIVAQQPNGYFVFDGTTLWYPGQTLPDAPGTVAPAAEFVASIAQADGVGSISGTTLTITQWNFGAFGAGQELVGAAAGQTIVSQATGTSGQIGTYTVTPGMSLASTEISVAGTSMNVTNLISGVIAVGNELSDPPTSVDTTVTGQTSGPSGGAGLYTVSVPQFVASGTITVGNFYSGTVPTGVQG